MRILVTGAGGAIGSEITRQLVEHGVHVLAQDVRPEGLQSVADAEVTSSIGNLLDPTYLTQLRELVAEQPLHAVIAAHGIDGSGSLAQATDDFVRRVMSVNAQSVSLLLSTTLESLVATSGVFVVVASQAGLYAEANNVAYCASKFALVGWIRALAPSLLGRGVKLRGFCPGCTETPLLFAAQERFAAAEGVSASEFLARRRKHIPIEKFADVAETAASAIYLTNRDSPRPVLLAATGGEVLY